MLHTVLNRSWKDPTNEELCGYIPPVSKSLPQQRMRFAGHCWRSKEELAGDVLLWKPTRGHQPRRRPKKTDVDELMDNTGCSVTGKFTDFPVCVIWYILIRKLSHLTISSPFI